MTPRESDGVGPKLTLMHQRATHSLQISVALCTYNGAQFVGEQVRSLLAQTRLPKQIVLSDDASSDDTVDIVRQEVERFNAHRQSPVELTVLINALPLGVTRNFEQAIGLCTGDLIALCDQDDIWHASKLERMAHEFENRPDLSLLHSDLRLVDRQGKPLHATVFSANRVATADIQAIHSGGAADVLLRRNLVTGASTMFRRELTDVGMPFPNTWVHDEWLGIVASMTGTVDCIEDALVDYRQHGGNQIGASKMKFHHYVQRLISSRKDRNARLLSRARSLAAHPVMAKATGFAMRVEQKLAHEITRSSYPVSRWRRLGPVWREFRTGRYHDFGLGFQDVVRDLIQAD